MRTLPQVTAIPEGEFTEHVSDLLDRARSGEPVVITSPSGPPLTLRRTMTWDEFWSALAKLPPDPAFAADVRDPARDHADDDVLDPWQRWA